MILRVHVSFSFFLFFLFQFFMSLYSTSRKSKKKQGGNKFFVDVRQICSLSCMEKKYINSEERIEILNVAGGRELWKGQITYSCLLSFFFPFPSRVRLFQRTRCRISLSNCDLAGREQGGGDNRRPTTALSAGKSEIAINYVPGPHSFSPSPVSIEGLVRNVERGGGQDGKVQ